MAQYETIRLYSRKRKEIAQGYYEIPYTEYRVVDGIASLKQIGTEDFTTKRYNDEMNCKSIYTWDGERLNKGNHRWFDYRGFTDFIGSTKALKAVMAQKYHAEIVDLR